MPPALIIVFSVLVRLWALWVAGSRILGLGLAGAESTDWQFLPALGALFFSVAPRPRPGSRALWFVSLAVFLAGIAALGAEYRLGYSPPVAELLAEAAVLAFSIGLQWYYTVRPATKAPGGWLDRL